jgi:hypothetical protein
MFLVQNGLRVSGNIARKPHRLMIRAQTPNGLACRYWILAVLVLAVFSAPAQEALRNSVAGTTAAETRAQQMQSQDYTFRSGDFRMLLTPAMSAQWNDNVNLSQTNLLDDYILTPSVGIVSSYPLTQRNVLFLDVTIGYSRYLKNSQLSTFDINSRTGTGLSFDIGIKDVTLNLHDWFSYTQDSSQNPTVANTANYGQFQNTAGLSALWDLNQVSLSAGYDHQNVISTSGEFNNINHSAEMFFLRSGLQVHPQVSLGLEATASLTRYDRSGGTNALNNNDAYTVGPYVEFRPSSALHVTARGGFSTYQFQRSSSSIETSSQNTWYAGLNLNHQIMESIAYTLDVGREESLGIQSDLTEDWYVRPSIIWSFIKDWSFQTGLSYQHGRQGVGDVVGNLKEDYDWYGGSLTLEHALTSRFTVGLNYRLTVRSSSLPDNGYTQNLVGLQITYRPQ